MNQGNRSVEFPCIKHFLRFWLASAVDSVRQGWYVPAEEMSGFTVDGGEITAQILPLYQVKDKTQVCYVSPIAVKLSKSLHGSSMDIANAIAEQLHQLILPGGDDNQQLFLIKLVSPGLINIQLADIAIAIWLENLIKIPPWIERGLGSFMLKKGQKKSETFSLDASSSIFVIQYTHARCCSLLRLGDREGIIILEEANPDTTPTFGKLIAPESIPWLSANHQLRLVHPAEKNLIYDFFAVLDTLYCPERSKNPISATGLANTICQSFEQFYRQCRIWGEVKTEAIELAQARLGLVAIAQAFLRLLLVDFLGVDAPLEL